MEVVFILFCFYSSFILSFFFSCLVPIDITTISVLYVFVDIKMDVQHFIDTVKHNISSDSKVAFVSIIQFAGTLFHFSKKKKKSLSLCCFFPFFLPDIAICSLFLIFHLHLSLSLSLSLFLSLSLPSPSLTLLPASLQNAKLPLSKYFGPENIVIPQSLPLSPGEVLGCTSPRLPEEYVVVVIINILIIVVAVVVVIVFIIVFIIVVDFLIVVQIV